MLQLTVGSWIIRAPAKRRVVLRITILVTAALNCAFLWYVRDMFEAAGCWPLMIAAAGAVLVPGAGIALTFGRSCLGWRALAAVTLGVGFLLFAAFPMLINVT
jgi:hypothetical protein